MKLLNRVPVCRPDQPLAAITVVDDVVYAGCPLLGSPDEHISRIRLSDFGVDWSIPAEGYHPDETIGSILMLSSPSSTRAVRFSGEVAWTRAVQHGAGVWRDRILFIGSPLMVVNAETGAVEETIAQPAGAVGVGTFLFGDVLIAMSRDWRRLSAFDLAARKLQWRVSLDRVLATVGVTFDGEPSILRAGEGGEIVGYGSGALFAMSPDSGETRWVKQARLSAVVPVTADGYVYATVLDPPRLVALEQHTGAVLFERPLDRRIPGFDVIHMKVWLSAAGEHLIATRRNGAMVVFSRRDGQPVATYKYRAGLKLAVATADRILVPSSDGSLLIFERP